MLASQFVPRGRVQKRQDREKRGLLEVREDQDRRTDLQHILRRRSESGRTLLQRALLLEQAGEAFAGPGIHDESISSARRERYDPGHTAVVPMIRMPRAAVAVLLICAGMPVRGPARAAGSTADGLLHTLGFTAAEIGEIDRGRPIARILETDRRQIAVAGAVRIAAPRDRLVDRFRTVDYLKRSAAVIEVGTFGDPPRAEDLRALPFEEYDLDLRDCRAGDCRVRLSAEDIARFHRQADWRSAGWQQRSAGIWRNVMAGIAGDYLVQGPSALPVYVNKPAPISVRDELNILVADSRFLADLAPELYAGLTRPPGHPVSRADQLTYWSKEDFGVRPIMRITHQTIYQPAPSGTGTPPVLIATTQLYADHYLDAALGLTLALDAPGEDSGFYLISVNRARTRSLTSWIRTVVRATVQSRSREAMLKILHATKAGLQAQ